MGVPLGLDAPRHDLSSVDDVLALVRESGGRVTNSRRLLLEAIFDDPGHHNAEDLAVIHDPGVQDPFKVEQHGIDYIPVSERWASPRDIFGMWAGASFQIAITRGLFQGTMAPTTPTGSRKV